MITCSQLASRPAELAHVARAMEPSLALALEQFADLHKAQLHAIGFPLALLSRLFSRLSATERENLDRYFEVCPDENETLSACGSVLKCRRSLQALSDVFVLQHWWECDGGQGARERLISDPELLARVEGMLGIRGKSGREREGAEEVRREMVSIVRRNSGKSEAVALKALADSGHDVIAAIISAETLTDEDVSGSSNQSSNPPLSLEEFRKGLSAVSGEPADDIPESHLQRIYDDYISRASHGSATKDKDGWVHCGGYSWRDGGEEGVVSVSVPLPSGTGKRKIVSKISATRWKFGLVGEQLMIEGEFSHRVVPDECFWTLDGGCVSLSVQKGEVEREWGKLLVGEVQLGREEVERVKRVRREWMASRVEDLMEKMWFVNQTYQAVTPEGQQRPVWYLLESRGLALVHSREPNFACHPFADSLTGRVVSLLWPLVDVGEGDKCSRNHVPVLYPGETGESRAAREAAILGFKGQPSLSAPLVAPAAMAECLLSPPSPSPFPSSSSFSSSSSFPFPTSSPVTLHISTNTSCPLEWEADTAGYSVTASPDKAELILGYHELLPDRPAPGNTSLARLTGDEVLVHRTRLCGLGRGRGWCVEGVDLRAEVASLASVMQRRGRGLARGWYVVLPDGPWSPVVPHVSDNGLEMVRWSEVGPAVAAEFCQGTVLYNQHRCCLQFSVVVVSSGDRLSAHLHPVPRVRLTRQPVGSSDLQPWSTSTLLTSPECTAAWSEVLPSLMTTSWAEVQPLLTEALAALFALALPHCTGRGALYTVNVLLQQQMQLLPLIIGVDPLPSFADSNVAKECLDLLLDRGQSDRFIHLV